MRSIPASPLQKPADAARPAGLDQAVLLQRGICLTLVATLLGIMCLPPEPQWRSLCHLYLLGVYVYLFYVIFAGPLAGCISGFHKAVVTVLGTPPLALLVGEFLTGDRPWLIYPRGLRCGGEGPAIETTSYAVAACFLVLFLAAARFRRNSTTTLRRSADTGLVFYALIVQSIVYATFSFQTDALAFIRGGYATSGSGPMGSINAWNAMATAALVLAWGYCRKDKPSHPLWFWGTVIYVVGFSSLMFGKRADIVGLPLVVLVALTRTRLSSKRMLQAAFVGALTVGIGIAVGDIRTRGWEAADLSQMSLLRTRPHSRGFYIPNVTEFYSSLPLVISYCEFDDGGLWKGRSYYNAATMLLPAAVNPYRIEETATTYLQAHYYFNPGGMYYVGELWINFGKWGALLMAPVVAWILSHLARCFWYSQEREKTAIGYAIIAAFPRWLLYGTAAFTKTLFILLLYQIGIMLLMTWQSRTQRPHPAGGAHGRLHGP